MLVGIVGAKLQGVEAAYLARKAGWEVRVVDKEACAPASGLSDDFVQADVTLEEGLGGVLGGCDFIIPALEDENALRSLMGWSRDRGVPLAFDPGAYAVSSSKLKSAALFEDLGLPTPAAWPQCDFPVLAKPDRGSGSKDIRIFRDLDSLKKEFPAPLPPAGWVLEEFLEGGQYSLEVIGRSGHYRALQVTDLYVDQDFDCKRVVAPSNLSRDLVANLEDLSLRLAAALDLNGIMDVEVVLSGAELKILEIDARLPSQTPTAVYWSTNQNMVALLGDLCAASGGALASPEAPARGAVYEHIQVSGDRLRMSGEHIMTEGGPLELIGDFFGADEAITNYGPGRDSWVATLIFVGENRYEVCEKRNRSIAEFVSRFDLRDDPSPIS